MRDSPAQRKVVLLSAEFELDLTTSSMEWDIEVPANATISMDVALKTAAGSDLVFSVGSCTIEMGGLLYASAVPSGDSRGCGRFAAGAATVLATAGAGVAIGEIRIEATLD